MFDEMNIGQVDQDTPASQPEKVEAAPAESSKESNLRTLRERAERAERRALELEQHYAQQQQPLQAAQDQDDEEDDFNIQDDGYIEGKDLKKYVKQLKSEIKKTKEEFTAYSQQSSLTSAELRLKAKYSDMDQVVTPDNLKKLAETKPSFYKSILSNPDMFEKGEAAYDMIKASGILPKYDDTDRRIEENKVKPRTAASIGSQVAQTPLARVGDYDRRILTEERKAQLREQVARARERG